MMCTVQDFPALSSCLLCSCAYCMIVVLCCCITDEDDFTTESHYVTIEERELVEKAFPDLVKAFDSEKASKKQKPKDGKGMFAVNAIPGREIVFKLVTRNRNKFPLDIRWSSNLFIFQEKNKNSDSPIRRGFSTIAVSIK